MLYTFDEALADGNILKTGTEREFPAPDNFAKLQRSIENARNVGKFGTLLSLVELSVNNIQAYSRPEVDLMVSLTIATGTPCMIVVPHAT